MKVRAPDALPIAMLGIVVACFVVNARLGRPLPMLAAVPVMLGLVWQYCWGPKRGDAYLLWAGLGVVEITVALTLHHEGLNIAALPLMVVGCLIALLLVVLHRIKRGYCPGIFSWFSNKVLPKQ